MLVPGSTTAVLSMVVNAESSEQEPQPSRDFLAQLADQLQRLDQAIAQIDDANTAYPADAVEAAREALTMLRTYLKSNP